MAFEFWGQWRRPQEAGCGYHPDRDDDCILDGGEEVEGDPSDLDPIDGEIIEQIENPQRERNIQPNTLDSLLEATTIKFSRRIKGREVVKLLCYVASQTDFIVDYRRERFGHIDVPKGKAKGRDMKVSGSFAKHLRYDVYAYFSCNEDFGHFGKFTEMRFDTPPGYDLSEVSPKLIESIDEIRRVVNAYFDQPREHEPL